MASPPTRARARSRRAAAAPPPPGTGTAACTTTSRAPRACAARTRLRMPDRQHDELVDALGRHQRHRPRHAGAPVVADDVRALDVQRVQDRDHVRDAAADAVRRSTSSGLPDSPKPRRSGAIVPKPAAVERWDLVAPEARGVRKAVQQQHRRAVAVVARPRARHRRLLIRRTIGQATGCGVSSTPRPLQPSGDTGLNRSVKASETRERVIVRFAGDSGDGMQLAGSRFTDATAVFGNDLATLPDFPAEIRAPAGTVAGVSAFQIHFAVARHPHAGRHAERAGGDEPGGAEGQPRR